MTCYDLFNGDADGICALQQLRLEQPREAVRISGLKREIDLLRRIEAGPGDEITVLDVALEQNREALLAALGNGARVFYADHHYPGEIPQSELLECHIDVTADTCTSLIINRYLNGTQARWGVVGAFGDNFDGPARELGASIGLDQGELTRLQLLGICVNYNGYGFELEDLLFHPTDLFTLLHPFEDPIAFIEDEPAYAELLTQYEDDLARAQSAQADSVNAGGAVYLLPNESWARRIVGVMGNDLAKRHPDRAHALLVDMGDGHHRVSVRAPYNDKQGADELCRQFPSGGGRRAAAGINALAQNELGRFVACFERQFGNGK